MINFITEPADNYHLMRGNGIDDGKFFSSHMLIDYLNNQKLFKRTHIDNAIEKKSKQCFEKGTAIHTYNLDGKEAFNKIYEIGYPLNKEGKEFGSTTETVAEYIEFAKASGKKVIRKDEYQDVLKISEEIKKHKEASEIISSGQNEKVLRVNYEGINCQIRIDNYTEKYGISDLKKTRCMKNFLFDAGGDYGYWIQAGFYAKIFEVATGIKANFNWIVVEDVEPFEVCIFNADDSHLDYAKRIVESGILEYKNSFKNNEWLTGREGINIGSWYKAMQNEGEIQ